ncbi:hypothetical protein CWI37_1543p0010, partial [Hamiltosporidium tvaerminnensis]
GGGNQGNNAFPNSSATAKGCSGALTCAKIIPGHRHAVIGLIESLRRKILCKIDHVIRCEIGQIKCAFKIYKFFLDRKLDRIIWKAGHEIKESVKDAFEEYCCKVRLAPPSPRFEIQDTKEENSPAFEKLVDDE